MTDIERLTPINSDQVSDDRARKVLAHLEKIGRDVRMAHLFANAENVFRPYVLMSDALMNHAALAPRLRELAILRLARTMDVAYEWWEHETISQQNGVTADEIAAIRVGGLESVELSAEDELVLRATDEWLSGEWRLSDETWQEGEQVLGRAALLDLTFTWAWWGAWVPSLVRTFQMGVPDEEREAG